MDDATLPTARAARQRSFRKRGHAVRMRIRGIPLWGWAAAAALYFGVAAAAVELAWDRSIDALAELGSHRLDLYAASLRSELGRYETMPRSSRGRKACARC